MRTERTQLPLDLDKTQNKSLTAAWGPRQFPATHAGASIIDDQQ